MRLELKFFASFRDAVGQKTVEREFPEGATVYDVFSTLEEEYPDLEARLLDDDGTIQPQLSTLKNGREVLHMQGVDTPLGDGDRLSVFPPVAGGSEGADAGDGSAAVHAEKSYRGISKRLAVHYLENLGGELVDGDPEDGAPARVEGEGWTVTLSSETVNAAGSLDLTEVSVVFEGEDGTVPELIEDFSQKAMRAGG